MLNRLPAHPGPFAALVAQLGNPKTAHLAKALGVSKRTIERWIRAGAPRTATLALWWLSQEGHSAWDAEMHNRTVLALQTNAALWREVRRLRGRGATDALARDDRPREQAPTLAPRRGHAA